MRSQKTTELARELRREQTPFEALLWKVLRDRQLESYKSRYQHPIPLYIADFACVSKKLVVQLDGRVHDETTPRAQNRDAVLQEQGWHVSRFSDVELVRSREKMVRTILHELEIHQ